MDFISFHFALYEISGYDGDASLDNGKCKLNDYEEAALISNIAADLHQLLNNENPNEKMWVEVNRETQKPIYNKKCADEIMDGLVDVAGWKRRVSKMYMEHFNFCKSLGLDFSDNPIQESVGGYQYSNGKLGRFFLNVGFDKNILKEFLDENGYRNFLKKSESVKNFEINSTSDVSLRVDGFESNEIILEGSEGGGISDKKVFKNVLSFREYDLSKEIELAQSGLVDMLYDYKTVWEKLSIMAKEKKGCLIEFVFPDEIKFKNKNEEIKIFTKNNLRDRLKRAKKKASLRSAT